MEDCTCGHPHTNSGQTLNAGLRQDPSRTSGILRRFNADINRRFKKFSSQINQAVVTLDVFGLNERQHIIQNADLEARQFEFSRSDQKVERFMAWLQEMEKKGVLETSQRPGVFTGEEPWTNTYIQAAYQRGIARAGEELRAKGYDVPEAHGFIPGITTDPIVLAFNQPFHAERVALLYTRTFSELKGITAAMDQQISRVLAEGMAEGRNPRDIARRMVDRVDKIGISRARTLARTEIIRAHHQATINTYEQWGVSGVTVLAEWLTAGYGVCPICVGLGRRNPYTLAEIRNMIPAHPNCRCVAIPVMKENPQARSTATRTARRAPAEETSSDGLKWSDLSDTQKRTASALERKAYTGVHGYTDEEREVWASLSPPAQRRLMGSVMREHGVIPAELLSSDPSTVALVRGRQAASREFRATARPEVPLRLTQTIPEVELNGFKGDFGTPQLTQHYVDLYHVTLNTNAESIKAQGFKAASRNQLQGWESAVQGTYGWATSERAAFEIERILEMSEGALSKGDLSAFHVRLPLSKFESKFRPDEDHSLDPREWRGSLFDLLSLAVEGDIPKKYIMEVMKLK